MPRARPNRRDDRDAVSVEEVAMSAASPQPLRTGEQFLADLRRRRPAIYLDGECIADAAEHPAVRAGARAIARMYDLAAAPENRAVMTVTSPDTGGPVWRCYQIPR